MIQSMTAFARVQRELHNSILCWEIRAVNNRYLDVSFRLPESFRFLETNLRAALRGKINRGKLECQLKFKEHTTAHSALKVNEHLLDSLLATGEFLAKTKNLPNDLSLTAVLTMPGMLEAIEPDFEPMAKDAESLFTDAIVELIVLRKREGLALADEIKARLLKLTAEVNKAVKEIDFYKSEISNKLLARIEELQADIDKTRLEQEVALIIARSDVSEELDRLAIHITEVEKALNSNEPSGRRLDFLMQELNREANTLGSKSDSSELTKSALEMKVLIEQMREQIQNIE